MGGPGKRFSLPLVVGGSPVSRGGTPSLSWEGSGRESPGPPTPTPPGRVGGVKRMSLPLLYGRQPLPHSPLVPSWEGKRASMLG